MKKQRTKRDIGGMMFVEDKERPLYRRSVKGNSFFKLQKTKGGCITVYKPSKLGDIDKKEVDYKCNQYYLRGFGRIYSKFPSAINNEDRKSLRGLYSGGIETMTGRHSEPGGIGYSSHFLCTDRTELIIEFDYPYGDPEVHDFRKIGVGDVLQWHISNHGVSDHCWCDWDIAATAFHIELTAFFKTCFLLDVNFAYFVEKWDDGFGGVDKYRGLRIKFRRDEKLIAFFELFDKEIKRLINKQDNRGNEQKVWADLVKKRDNFCVKCGNDEDLHAHHIESYADNPDLRCDIDNGVTLCKKCHNLLHQGKIKI